MVKRIGSLEAALSKYAKRNITMRVGVLEEAIYPDGTPVAQVAFWNEYGTSNAPARPFFRTVVNEQKANWVVSIKNLVQIHGDERKSMLLLGEHMKGQLVQSILNWNDPKNSATTIAIKGFDKPLVDTGQLSRSLSVEIEE